MAENNDSGCGCVSVIIGVLLIVLLYKLVTHGISISYKPTHAKKQTITVSINKRGDHEHNTNNW